MNRFCNSDPIAFRLAGTLAGAIDFDPDRHCSEFRLRAVHSRHIGTVVRLGTLALFRQHLHDDQRSVVVKRCPSDKVLDLGVDRAHDFLRCFLAVLIDDAR